ncbi:MAG: hypothetical protein ACXWT5_06030 [Methylophilus sp.]
MSGMSNGRQVIGGTSHDSGIAAMGANFDPTHHLFQKTGLKAIDPHTYAIPIADKSNKYLSKVVKPVHRLATKVDPLSNYLDKNVGLMHQWNQTVENRPVDAAAIVAATIFSGGALAGAGSGAGAAGAAGTSGATLAAPAASGVAGSSIGGLGAGVGASAITPTFASGLGAAGVSGAGSIGGGGLLAASGTGTLGAAGTSALGATFATPASMGGAGLATAPAWYQNPDNYQKMFKVGNQLNNQMNPQQQAQPVQPFATPRVAPMSSIGSSSSPSIQSNGQLADQYSSLLQQQIQALIDKQRNGSW